VFPPRFGVSVVKAVLWDTAKSHKNYECALRDGAVTGMQLLAHMRCIMIERRLTSRWTMVRERVQQVVLIVVGLLFLALAYPGVMFFSKDPGVPMIMSIYVTLGIFLLLAARNPAANRSLIVFAGWANVAHASVMMVQEYKHVIERQELVGAVAFGIVGIGLIVLAPAKQSQKQFSAVGAAWAWPR
jgi:hypothetical protein